MLYKNLPKQAYLRIIRRRFFLDYLSAAHYLLKGKWANAWAICKARVDFLRLKSQFRTVRHNNLKQSQIHIPDTMLPLSLIWEYYVKGKKKFSQYAKRTIA
jgi:hypothetical protein